MDWKTVGNYVLLVGLFVAMVSMFNQLNGRLDTLQAETNRRFDAVQTEMDRRSVRRLSQLNTNRGSHVDSSGKKATIISPMIWMMTNGMMPR